MLQSLSIKNVALIKNINVEFDKGLNILLGETGAGKSIIFDALNFVLGGKSDKTLLRYGESEMRVDAIFCDLSSQVKKLLEDIGFDGDEIGLSRTLNIDGKTSARVNGIPVVQAQLKDIGNILVDSYSQHENVQLLKSKNHLLILDKFGGEEVFQQKEIVKEVYNRLSDLQKQIDKFGGNEFDRERKLSLLNYQIKEIEDANLVIGEEEQLNEKLKFYNNSERIFESVSLCEQLLNESQASSLSQLQQAINALSGYSQFPNIEECRERLENSKYEIEDVCDVLKEIRESTDYDENEFERIDRRNDIIKSLIKKYGGSIESALSYLKQAKQEYDELIDSEEILAKLEEEKTKVEKQLLEVCENLSKLRKSVAEEIRNKIVKQLQELGMKSSQFEVNFKRMENPSKNGFDDVEFIFSANKGQETKSLSKTASGGELSRFMLAFKNIFAEIGDAQTLVFDEIDSGISGETGNIIGQKLKNITSNVQVICITHLPQVASFGDKFYYVSKEEDSTSTITKIKELDDKEIVYNIARMVVGDNVTQTAIKQAEEMREKAQKV